MPQAASSSPAHLLLAILRRECGSLPEENIETHAFSPEHWQNLLSLSRRHDLAHFVGHFLSNCSEEERSGTAFEDFYRSYLSALYRYEDAERQSKDISALLGANAIPHVFLKGATIGALYPLPWMRTSGDIDLLVREEDTARAVDILTKSGYTAGEVSGHHITLHGKGTAHLELHFNVLEGDARADAVLARAWEYAAPCAENPYLFAFTPAFLRFHAFAHTAYHFLHGGCGIRAVLDLYLLMRAPREDAEKERLQALLDEGGLALFADRITALGRCFFEKAEMDALMRDMGNYIVRGGRYGVMSGSAAVSQASGAKTRTLARSVFLPCAELGEIYPALKKHPALLPFFEVRRWLAILFSPKRRRRGAQTLRSHRLVSDEKKEKTAAMLSALGLVDRD